MDFSIRFSVLAGRKHQKIKITQYMGILKDVTQSLQVALLNSISNAFCSNKK